MIKEDPFISTQKMSVVMSVVPRTVKRNLSILQKKGVIIREGNTSAGHWILLINNELENFISQDTSQSNTKNDTQGDTQNDTKDVTKNVTKDVTKELTDRQKFILEMIAKNALVTIPEMSLKTGVTLRTIKRDIEDLQSRGIIIREGGRKAGHWVILKSISKE